MNYEANLVERLRDSREALFELVAENEAAMFGHTLVSALNIKRADETLEAALLAPVSVLPAFQRQGVGGALVEAAKVECQQRGVPAMFVYGHAHYYPRFGFSAEKAALVEAPWRGPEFMALELIPACLTKGGRMRYPRAFGILL